MHSDANRLSSPSPQYVDAVRHGDLPQFLEIEQHTSDWWFPTLDRGAGAALHIACDHGQARARTP